MLNLQKEKYIIKAELIGCWYYSGGLESYLTYDVLLSMEKVKEVKEILIKIDVRYERAEEEEDSEGKFVLDNLEEIEDWYGVRAKDEKIFLWNWIFIRGSNNWDTEFFKNSAKTGYISRNRKENCF